MYDYYENVKDDVRTHIYDYYSEQELAGKIEDDPEELKEELNENMWTDDSVTGNGSGSYTFNSVQAAENLVGNFGLIQEAYEEFGYDSISLEDIDPEKMDVTIRCYYLRRAIDEVIDEM